MKICKLFIRIKKYIRKLNIIYIIYDYINYIIKGYKIFRCIIKRTRCDTLICIPYSASGDIYYIGKYLKSYLDKNSIKNYRIIISKEENAKLLQMYDVYDICILSQSEVNLLVKLSAFLQESVKEIRILHFSNTSHIDIVKDIEGINGICYIEMYKNYFRNYVESTSIYKNKNSFLKVHEIMSQFDLQYGKTVIICPYAKSLPTMNIMAWNYLMMELKNKGYSILINENPVRSQFKQVNSYLPAYDELIPLVEACGYVIAIRSGLCDILTEARCNKYYLYPTKFRWGCTYAWPYFSFQNKSVHEYEFVNDQDLLFVKYLVNEIEASSECVSV